MQTRMQPIEITPIGVVRTEVKDAVDTNWGKIISEIHLRNDLIPGLQGLEDWSHLVIIFLMHETQFNPETDLIRRPQERDDMPEVGIFAQRARHRPNRIGITAVRFMGGEGAVLRVKGLDAIDGTPVLDIKPYAPAYDGATEPLVPSWFIRLMQGYF